MEARESNIRELIREFIEEEMKNEMSGAPAIAGFVQPLGMPAPRIKEPKVKKSKKESKSKTRLKESISGQTVGDLDFTFHNHFRYTNNEDTYGHDEHFNFYDAIQVIADAFARAENPFGKNRNVGTRHAIKYLQGDLEYPHKT